MRKHGRDLLCNPEWNKKALSWPVDGHGEWNEVSRDCNPEWNKKA